MSIEVKIPIPVLPTDEEMIEVANNWWKLHDKINFLDWNETLINNSMPFTAIKISPDFTERILDVEGNKEKFMKVLPEFQDIINPYLKGEMFFKTITRSPKDFISNCRVQYAVDILSCILGSERVFEDLCLLKYIDKCYLILRPFIHIEKRNEFRVFIYDGEINGISQYFYNETFNYTEQELEDIERTITTFVQGVVIPNVPRSNLVCDVLVNTGGKLVKLIELNPYWMSDPCLFGAYSQLDGSFKILPTIS